MFPYHSFSNTFQSPCRPLIHLLNFICCLLLLNGSNWCQVSVCGSSAVDTSVLQTGRVNELTDGNFDEELMDREVVVNFFAPWCGACQQFKPVYADFASALPLDPSPIRHVFVARVDCTLNPEVATAKGIRAFPTIKFFRNGVVIGDYEGERTQAGLLKWVNAMSQQGKLSGKRSGENKPQMQQQPQQTQAQTQPSSATSPAISFALPDLDTIDFTDPQQIKKLVSGLLDIPLLLFQSHPYMVMTIVYVLGLFQGVFFGIIYVR